MVRGEFGAVLLLALFSLLFLHCSSHEHKIHRIPTHFVEHNELHPTFNNKYFSPKHRAAIGNTVQMFGGFVVVGYYYTNITIGTPAQNYNLIVCFHPINNIIETQPNPGGHRQFQHCSELQRLQQLWNWPDIQHRPLLHIIGHSFYLHRMRHLLSRGLLQRQRKMRVSAPYRCWRSMWFCYYLRWRRNSVVWLSHHRRSVLQLFAVH